MRNPNGYGSVYRLQGNRRKPWAARKTIGKKSNGQLVYAFVGFYATKKEAMEALAKYNASPYDTRTTFEQIHAEWYARAVQDVSPSTKRIWDAAYDHAGPLHRMKLSEIRLQDMQRIADGLTAGVGKQYKALLSHVFEYAVQHEIVTADRHQLISFVKLSDDQGNTITRKIFTREEVAAVTDPLVLILLYTGMRVGELLALRKEDVHLEERWFQIREAKTQAGVRKVPIAEKIVPCFSAIPATVTYELFKRHFRQNYGGHLPHDTRHTFISRMADLGIDERVTKAIVGHAGSGITETVYTHVDMEVLKAAVDRL